LTVDLKIESEAVKTLRVIIIALVALIPAIGFVMNAEPVRLSVIELPDGTPFYVNDGHATDGPNQSSGHYYVCF